MISKKVLFAFLFAYAAYLVVKFNIKTKVIEVIQNKILNLYSSKSDRLFNPGDLKPYNGENGSPIYLSILGNVFDVTQGRKHYGKDGAYNIFAGRDASAAFVTGNFSPDGLTDDISAFSLTELGELHDWLQKYKEDYIYKGKLIGRFYDNYGNPTPFLESIKEKLSHLRDKKKDTDQYKTRYPPCNVEWTPDVGSRFWCSEQSGGIKRNWIGVPRKFYEPGSSKSRCACVNQADKNLDGKFLQYEGCPSTASSCTLTPQ